MPGIRFDDPQAVMRHALELARRGVGYVEPNPPVGAVLVDDDLVAIGEGFHDRFGGPHAEIHALANADPKRVPGATLFVTLEPCCHHGKTPPCSQAVIDAGIRRVFIATRDPAAHVNGGGIQQLQQAGIDVQVGILADQAQELIAPFAMLQEQKRPWTIAKWAMSLDGRTAARTGHSQWISNEQSRRRVHELRQRMDGIVVGIETALADDPRLDARPAGARIALRIVIDTHARLPVDGRLALTAREIPVLVCTTDLAPAERIDALQNRGVEVQLFPSVSDSVESPHIPARVELKDVWQELGRRQMTNVLVEGGSGLFGGLFDRGLIDELHCFIGPKLIGGTEARGCIGGLGRSRVPEIPDLVRVQSEQLGDDVYITGRIRRSRQADRPLLADEV